MDDQATMQAGETPRRPAFLNRFWMVFVQPGKLFEDLARNPAWFPIALFVAVATAAILGMYPAELMEEQMRARGAVPADTDAAIGIIKIATVAGTIVFLPIMTLVVSAVTYAIFVFMRGDEATYRQHLCVVAHAGIISLAGTAITVPLQIRTGNPELGMSLGTLAPFLPDGFLLTFLNVMPLFQLWAIVVTGIGLAVLDPRRSAGTTIAVLMVLQVVVALACAGIATGFSATF